VSKLGMRLESDATLRRPKNTRRRFGDYDLHLKIWDLAQPPTPRSRNNHEQKECDFDVLMDVRNPSNKLSLSTRINIGSGHGHLGR
jgi:hypothetical protein